MVAINSAITWALVASIAVLTLVLVVILLKDVASFLFAGSLRKRKNRLKSLILELDGAGAQRDQLQREIETLSLAVAPTIIEMMPRVSRGTRSFLSTVLAERGVVARYEKELARKNPARRVKGARTLGIIQADQAVPALIGHLKDPDRLVRQEVARALSEIRDKRALGPLVDFLKEPGWGDLSIVAQAVAAYGMSAEPIVRPLLQAESATPRYWAAEVLGRLKSRQAVDELILALHDEQANVRGVAARALGLIGSVKAIDPLAKAASDRSWFVRSRAVEALGRFLSRPLAAAHVSFILSILIFVFGDREWSVREKVVEALSKLDNPMVSSYLIKAVSNEDERISCECAKMLGTMKTKAAFGALVHALASESADLRAAAAEALGRLGDEEALPHLIDCLADKAWFVQERAAKALGEVGDRRALDALYLMSTSKNWWVRFRAKEAVKRILAKAPKLEAETG